MQDNTGFYFLEGNFCGWNPPTVKWWNYQEKKSDIREGTLSALGGEIRGLRSQAGWGWMAVWSAVCSQELAPAKDSCPLAGLGQTSAGWVGGRRGKPACGRAPFTERQVAQCACVLGILVPTPPIIPVSFPPLPPTPRSLKCWQAPSSTQGSWPLLQLSWLRTPILFSGNLNKQGPLKKTKLRLWIPSHSREILKP